MSIIFFRLAAVSILIAILSIELVTYLWRKL